MTKRSFEERAGEAAQVDRLYEAIGRLIDEKADLYAALEAALRQMRSLRRSDFYFVNEFAKVEATEKILEAALAKARGES